MVETTHERHRDVDRFLTFVDAVVAIAITLLVLPLVEFADEVTGTDDVATVLRDHSDELWAFALSFFVIARLWLVQHRVVGHLMRPHRAITSLLLLWTFTIVVVPFATGLVAAASDDDLVKTIYFGTLAAGTACLALVGGILGRRPELTDGADATDPVRGWANVVLLLVALGVGVLVDQASYFPLLLLLLDGPVAAVLHRVAGRSRAS